MVENIKCQMYRKALCRTFDALMLIMDNPELALQMFTEDVHFDHDVSLDTLSFV